MNEDWNDVESRARAVAAAWNDDEESAADKPQAASAKAQAGSSKPQAKKRKMSKNRRFAIAALVVGLLVLACGGGFLAYKMLAPTAVEDAAYLVQIGTWQRADAPGVIWDFTDIGEGSLTTNDHTNNYDFIWALDGDQLKIDTDWLYTLHDTYTYRLDQSAGQLILESDGEGITLVPASAE